MKKPAGKPSEQTADVATKKAPERPFKPGLQSRQAAAKLLAAVVDKYTPLDGMLDLKGGNPAFLALADNDRALVRAMLSASLRHLPQVDAIIDSLIGNPLPEGARALYHVLTIAAVQILYLDVPDHSAVDLAVEQANRDPRLRRFSKLVNAVLRRMSREKDMLLAMVVAIPVMPPWYVERLAKDYGQDVAEAIARAQMVPAPIDLTVKSDPEGWAARLGGIVLPTGSVRLTDVAGAITELAGFAEGAWWVQDAAASLPARLLGDLKGKRVADLCAAPGGKTAQLILAGAEVTALDQSSSRLKRLAGNLERLGLSAHLQVGNLLDFIPDQPFDAVLLDAPCSSTGTTRRHPDVLWTKGPDDIARLAELQERLLAHAITLVRPGGLIVFSNCSLERAEGEDVVARLLASRDDVERVVQRKLDWPGLEDIVSPEGDLRTHPAMLAQATLAQSGMDGFYAALLRRKDAA